MDGKTIQVLQQSTVLEADEQGTSIRNDFVLTKRDATVESSFYVSLLTEAKKLIDGGANISLEAMINNVVTEMGSGKPTAAIRSEEHTSELQSRPHLVCRLLLEKKKKK